MKYRVQTCAQKAMVVLNNIVAQGDRAPVNTSVGDLAFFTDRARDMATERKGLLLTDSDLDMHRVKKPGEFVWRTVGDNTIDTILAWGGGTVVAHDALKKGVRRHNIVERDSVNGTDVLSVVGAGDRSKVTNRD